ncbi:UNVERIFIED_CONTAM: hypothetical protein FKN15_019620 [Acipenser sinensis]
MAPGTTAIHPLNPPKTEEEPVGVIERTGGSVLRWKIYDREPGRWFLRKCVPVENELRRAVGDVLLTEEEPVGVIERTGGSVLRWKICDREPGRWFLRKCVPVENELRRAVGDVLLSNHLSGRLVLS